MRCGAGLAGLVVVLKLFNPIFLPGPWLVLGSLVELAAKGQLWIHVAATLERVAIGFGTGAALGVALGLAAGYLAPVRNVVEPLVEMLRPIPPLAMLPMFIVWVGIGESLQGRVHHLRHVLSDLPDHRDRRAPDRSAPAARGAEPRRRRIRSSSRA